MGLGFGCQGLGIRQQVFDYQRERLCLPIHVVPEGTVPFGIDRNYRFGTKHSETVFSLLRSQHKKTVSMMRSSCFEQPRQGH